MTDRPLAFLFDAFEIGMTAKAGVAAQAHRLRLATAALAPDVDEAGRAAARQFLATAAGGDVQGAGDALVAWVSRRLPAPPPPEYDWQARKDLA